MLDQNLLDGLIAAAVSGENALLFGAAGWGKTRAALTFLRQVFPPDEYGEQVGFLVLSPATPPERVEGSIDIPRYLEKGEIVQTVKGTPHDVRFSAWVLDEIGRGNEAVLDALLPVLEGHDNHSPLVIATTNFMPRGARYEALKTRFGLWVDWNPPAEVDDLLAVARRVIDRGDDWGVELTQDVLDAIEHARAADTLRVDADRLRPLVEVALEERYPLTPRWMRIMANVYGKGTEYFAALGFDLDDARKEAFKWLAMTVPTLDHELREKWRGMVLEMVAPEEGAINRALQEWREVVREYKEAPANKRREVFDRLRVVYANTTQALVDIENEYGVDTSEIRTKKIVAEFLALSKEV